MRVLVADDEPAARLLAQAVVAAAGHEVVTAADGAEALRTLADGFDVLITDARMPGLSGFDLAAQVRQDSARYVYVIMLTGLQDDHERLAGMHAGVDDYLTKPVRPATLTSLLVAAERVVSLHRELEAQRQALEQRATHDALTGVFNRRRLDEDLPALLGHAQRYSRTFSVAIVDVDRFKRFNDAYGHLAGDRALRTVAAVLRAQLRDSDSVYRYGGEEFVCLLPEQDADSALIAVERVRAAVRASALPHEGSEHGVVTISAGVVTWQADPACPESLVDAADRALFLAKDAGRDQVVSAPAG